MRLSDMFESGSLRRFSGKRPDRTPKLESLEQWRDFLIDRLPGFQEEPTNRGYVLMFGTRGTPGDPAPYRVIIRIQSHNNGKIHLSVSAFRGPSAYRTINIDPDPKNVWKILDLARRGAATISAGIQASEELFGKSAYQVGGW